MKTKRAFVAAAVLAALALGACGGGTGASSNGPDPKNWRQDIEGSDLEVGVLPAKGTEGLKYLKGLAKELESDYPGTEVTLTFANTKARPALEQRWRGGEPPDVDYGMFDGTDPSLVQWADSGKLLNLTPYLKQEDPKTGEPWIDRFSPAVREFMAHPETGKIYAVPSELSLHVLYYNAKIFRKNSIQPPRTWNDLLSACDKLKAAGVDPIALTGLFEPYMGMWSDHLWLRTVGYDKTREVVTEGKGHITDDPGFLKGLRMLQQLRDKDAFLEGFKGTDFTAAQAQFFQGKAGMILMGTWLVSEMADVIPKDFELGVVPFPTVPGGGGDQDAIMAALQQVSISSNSDNIPLALEWARRLTSKKVQTDRAKQLGQLSAVKGVPSPPGQPGIDKIVQNAESFKPREYGVTQSKAKDVVYPEIARLLFGKQDAKETLNRLDKGLRRVYKN